MGTVVCSHFQPSDGLVIDSGFDPPSFDQSRKRLISEYFA